MQVEHPVGRALLANLESVILGKRAELSLMLVGVLAEGHLLLEDVPGVGKTTLARALARSVNLDFKRVQFTPDLLPTDILGATVLRPHDGSFAFEPGPIFTHILLADEINRASPRAQSALLEAMSETQVTSDGETRPLPAPFLVIATQNPVDHQGTYPLPEAQLDRFLMRIGLGYPSAQQELEMLFGQLEKHPLEALEPVTDGAGLLQMQAETRKVRVERRVAQYMLALVGATRDLPDLTLGVSPRGSLALFRAAQARALLAGRDYVVPEDVKALAVPVLSHRILLSPEARYAGRSEAQLIGDVLERVAVPT